MAVTDLIVSAFPIFYLSTSTIVQYSSLVTAPCDIDNFCYANTALIQDYLNLKHVWQALGVPSDVKKFVVGSQSVAKAFARTNDLGISTEPQVVYLLNSGVDVLFYSVSSYPHLRHQTTWLLTTMSRVTWISQ